MYNVRELGIQYGREIRTSALGHHLARLMAHLLLSASLSLAPHPPAVATPACATLARSTPPLALLPTGWAARTALLTGASTVASTVVAVRQAHRRRLAEEEATEVFRFLMVCD